MFVIVFFKKYFVQLPFIIRKKVTANLNYCIFIAEHVM